MVWEAIAYSNPETPSLIIFNMKCSQREPQPNTATTWIACGNRLASRAVRCTHLSTGSRYVSLTGGGAQWWPSVPNPVAVVTAVVLFSFPTKLPHPLHPTNHNHDVKTHCDISSCLGRVTVSFCLCCCCSSALCFKDSKELRVITSRCFNQPLLIPIGLHHLLHRPDYWIPYRSRCHNHKWTRNTPVTPLKVRENQHNNANTPSGLTKERVATHMSTRGRIRERELGLHHLCAGSTAAWKMLTLRKYR